MHNHHTSLDNVNNSVNTTHSNKWKRLLSFLGPAYLVSVGYMDPGNWATDLQGGAQFGYKLIWVLLMSNLMALVLQNMSARLGIVARKDLAQMNRVFYPPIVNIPLYLFAEIAIAACDLAEVLGMAIGLNLLTGLPILWGILITALDTFLLLWLQQFGIRKLEAFILSLVAIIAGSFFIELFLAKPDLKQTALGCIPTHLNKNALYIAIGIIGATVMPHNLYLHSSLVQTRKIDNQDKNIKKAIKLNLIDTTIALNAAFFVNASILILAASVFYSTGNYQVAKLQEAHQLLAPLLGSKLAPILFAIALIAAGQSSTITGTLAGQIVMEGYLHLRINPWLRRLITRLLAIVPAVITILISGNDKLDDLLVFSQVILSLQLGFAIIPLLHFVSSKKVMGKFTISTFWLIIGIAIASLLVFLNARLVIETCTTIWQTTSQLWVKALIVLLSLGTVALFLAMTLLPLIKPQVHTPIDIHQQISALSQLQTKAIDTIGISLDFSDTDEKLIAHGLTHYKPHTTIYLIHITESATAKYLGQETDDNETRKDIERLEIYCNILREKGYNCNYALGFRNRVKEIVRISNELQIDLLIMGAHRHTGLKDLLFGETINSVRHRLTIPILVI